jgi:hypothetical protein
MNQASELERFTRTTQRYDDLEKPTAAAVESGSRYVIYGPNEFFWSSAMAERAHSNESSGAAWANQLLRISLESAIERPFFMNWSNQFVEDPGSLLGDRRFSFAVDDNVTVEIGAHLNLEATLDDLETKWRRETSFLSSMSAKIDNQWYQKIIALGQPVIPLLLRRLQKTPDHWFEALRKLTSENPARDRPEIRGNLQAIADCWIAWGEEHDYI